LDNKRFSLKLNYEIEYLNRPSYELPPFGVNDDLNRFDERKAAFYNDSFTAEQMKGDNWRDRMAAAATKKILKAARGYNLLDYAFSEAAWTSYHPYDQSPLISWKDQPEMRRPYEKKLQEEGHPWNETPEQNSAIIKKSARFFGAAAVGIAPINQLWFYANDREGLPVNFSADALTPEITATERVIPASLNRVIVMLVAQDRELALFAPSPLAGAAVGLGYSHMAELASKIANLVRGLGYQAVPMGNDTSLSIPMAIDAGLGEAGRHGLLLNPDYGSLVRICKVLTDLPLATDRPLSFGAASICGSCTICADHCPARAISFDREPTYETRCPSNNEGIKRWTVNSWSCLKFWVKNGKDCGICQAVCPFSRTDSKGMNHNDPAAWWNE
jgi:epoxyqueuosine reductase